MKLTVLTSIIVLALLSTQFFNSGCANVIPPQGGPRDSLPPLLVAIDPRDSMTNFNDPTITFTFDEYVTLDQPISNILVTPIPEKIPSYNSKLRTVTVKLNDPLEANTTYVIDFGTSIRDVNESNILRGFSYIFTTGDHIDTLELEGKVILAETGKIDTTLTVMLHRSGEDSLLSSKKPRYVTRVDGQGNFRYKFLAPGTYYIYALKDDNRRYSYMPGSPALFAFSDKPVVVGVDSTEPVVLYAYAEKPSLTSGTTLTQARPGGGNNSDRRLIYFNSLNNQAQDLLSQFYLNFQQPLRTFDSSKLVLTTDSTYNPVTNYRWDLDTSRKKLTLIHTWKENTRYNLVLDIDFAEDTLGRKLLKTDTLHFMTKKQGEYGQLKITFRNLDLSRKPVLQFVQSGVVKNAYPLSSEIFTLPYMLPGEYELSILYDTNGNGKWDPGEFFKVHRQPEIVVPIERKITVRSSFDNQFEIELK